MNFYLDTAGDHGNIYIFFQCNIAFSVVHVDVCFNFFNFIAGLFLSFRPGQRSLFVFLMGNNNCTARIVNTNNYV